MSYIGNTPFTAAFLTDTFSGDGSDTTFTLSAAPANTSSIIVAVSGVLQDPSTYSVSGTTLTFSAAPPTGTDNISVRFLGIPASGVTTTAYRTVTEFTATAGQTSFSVPSYTAGYVDVYRNGVMLGTADFTATSGTTVVLSSGATAGDLIRVESFYVSSVLNAIPATAGAVNNSYINSMDSAKLTGAIDVNASAPADSLAISSAGNVGVGTTSPAVLLHVYKTTGRNDYRIASGSSSGEIASVQFYGTDSGSAAQNYAQIIGGVTTNTAGSEAGYLSFETVGSGSVSERMRIDSSGNLLVGTTSASGLLTCIGSTAAGYAGYFTGNYTASNNANIMFWGRNGGAVAAAVRYKDSGTSMEFYSPTGHTVAYTTSSDYRLKENVAPMTGALATVAQLKPVTYTWKEGFGTGQSQGFIAHELQAVVPDCVTGEKDAVETYTDEEGNEQTRPVYQGVDTSFLVATLTAAIQELKAELDAAKERIAALEAK